MKEESQLWASYQNRHPGKENSTATKQFHKYLSSSYQVLLFSKGGDRVNRVSSLKDLT